MFQNLVLCLEGLKLDPHTCLARQQYPLPGVTVGSMMNGSTNKQNIKFYIGREVFQRMRKEDIHIEVRSFMANHPHTNKPPYQRFTHRWPINSRLEVNKVTCPALQQTNCHKDKPFTVPRSLLRPGDNTLTITYLDDLEHILVLGLFGVCPPNVVVEEVTRHQTMSYSDAHQHIIKAFCGDEWDNQDVGPSSTTISLECPVTMQRIQTPARGKTCKHIRCFDLGSHVQSAKESIDPPIWMCPICEQPARPHQLTVDPRFGEVLKEMPLACSRVEVQPDGQFGRGEPSSCSSNRKRKAEVVEVDDES